MTQVDKTQYSKVNLDKALRLYPDYPTHRHAAEFWEQLGRTIGTLGFLEEVLGKAIFVFTGTRKYPENEVEKELEKWFLILEGALTNPLQNLIEKYIKSLRDHPDMKNYNIDELEKELLKAPPLRNALCHASWPPPDASGKSIPFYVKKKNMEKFETPVGVDFLIKTREGARNLAFMVIDTVTGAGYQFPGSNGPGLKLW